MNKVSGLLKIALLSLSNVFTIATSRNSVGNISKVCVIVMVKHGPRAVATTDVILV